MKVRPSVFTFIVSIFHAVFATLSSFNEPGFIFNSLMVVAWGFRSIVCAIEESGHRASKEGIQ